MSSFGETEGEDGSQAVLLRWSDSPDAPSREQLVEILENHFFEARVRMSSRLSEETRVFLVAKHYTESGVVRSCEAYGAGFIVTIRFNPSDRRPWRNPDRDPGALAVDDFLTEEQERLILQELEEEFPDTGTGSH